MSNNIITLKNEIELIKKRNGRVEAEKAWETSFFRKVCVAILTYFVIVLFFYYADLPNPLTNSIVPALGFLLSTASLPYLKKIWAGYFYKK